MHSRDSIVGLFGFIAVAGALLPDGRPHANVPPLSTIPKLEHDAFSNDNMVFSRNGTQLSPYVTVYYFDQLIDHNNPSLGTFKQRFWHTYEFYEPGGPIVLMNLGEVNAEGYTGYLTNSTINGLIAQQENGAVVLMEHRFFGLSNPYPDLSGKSMSVHTVQQSIEDIEHFARNVELPMPNGKNLGPDKAAWIMTGGSYPGALTSYTMVNKPGLMWAGYASSGPVQVMENFWVYFEPIRKNMPQNCSADVEAVIAHLDQVFSGTNSPAKQAIKNTFGMGTVQHDDDFLGALRNDLWAWQELQPDSGPGARFYKFCDALEVKNGVNAPASGWGLNNALAAWGKRWQSGLPSLCGSVSIQECFDSYTFTPPDTSIDQEYRSWNWILCNEFGFSQSGPPANASSPAIVSHLVVPEYDIRQCVSMYPDVFTASTEPNFAANTARTNQKYAGWNVKADRLYFSNARRDTWKEGSVSAEAVNIASTDSQPIYLSEGFHASDLLARFAAVNPSVASAQQTGLAAIRRWMQEWKQQH
ncbi:hypothetical protein L218DRAFT_922990 [Marasmius fiardii PR-910]|nr:hypothetical protein L218DRAFT_922990 [Marasmius fiardii PR-910]